MAHPQILPGTGRCPAGAEGSHLAAHATPIERRDPSVSRFASATSPCRGGFSTDHTYTPVTLNSFQGPSLGLRRSVAKSANLAAARSMHASGSAARLMLKQVQHDVFWQGVN